MFSITDDRKVNLLIDAKDKDTAIETFKEKYNYLYMEHDWKMFRIDTYVDSKGKLHEY